MTEAFFIRTATGLAAADDAARELLHGIAIGKAVSVSISRPRNGKMNRLYWALMSAIASSTGTTRDNISDYVKLRTGHYVTLKTSKGLFMLPRSISFAKLDQAAFDTFFAECCRVVIEEFLPHMQPSDLVAEIHQMVGLTEA